MRRWQLLPLLLVLLASASLASPETAIRSAAASAGAAAWSDLLARLEARVGALAASAPAGRLAESAEAYDALVVRARSLDAPGDAFARLAGLGGKLESSIARSRDALETAAGEDERALEALYTSERWRRLDYAEAVLGHGRGWAELGHGERLAEGAARRQALGRAEAAFSRAALELALPELASWSALGLGLVRRAHGDRAGARSALERFRAGLPAGERPALRAAVAYELAVIALEEGDPARAQRELAALPEGALDREQRLGLVRAEAEAWLARAPRDAQAAARAAARLRELAAAGGDWARAGAQLASEHRELLRGLEVGPIGALLAAEEAFAAGRFADAAARFRAVLDGPSVPGLDAAVARYKLAASLAQTGEAEAALAELERLLAGGGGGTLREPAARLQYTLAETRLAEAGGGAPATLRARAERAARQLLAIDPQAPDADRARWRASQASGARDRVALLAAIEPGDATYPSARLELARLRAEALQREANRGRAPDRAAARALADDLDAVSQLVADGRLAADPARDATLGVLRARAAAWAGEAPQAVLARVAEAEQGAGLDAAGQRSLRRLRLQMLARAARWQEVTRRLDATQDAALRRDFEIWLELFRELGRRRAPGALIERLHQRLAAVARRDEPRTLALLQMRALRRAGLAEPALALADAWIARDESFGEAWIERAEALAASGRHEAAADAWLEVARGTEPASARWWRAQLARAEALRQGGDAELACATLEAARAADAEPASRRLRSRLARALEPCPPIATARAPGEAEAAAGPR